MIRTGGRFAVGTNVYNDVAENSRLCRLP
jgi:hypothetical protein